MGGPTQRQWLGGEEVLNEGEVECVCGRKLLWAYFVLTYASRSESDSFYYLHYKRSPFPDHSLVLSNTEVSLLSAFSHLDHFRFSERCPNPLSLLPSPNLFFSCRRRSSLPQRLALKCSVG